VQAQKEGLRFRYAGTLYASKDPTCHPTSFYRSVSLSRFFGLVRLRGHSIPCRGSRQYVPVHVFSRAGSFIAFLNARGGKIWLA
jgi:hypothetical protein